ncbi:MAG: MBL fold metallo-hydrolase [Candidatus Paceibacterota bacterium]|jgi:metallo-beta-lactamase family protein
MDKKKTSIDFFGGTENVTGSNFLVTDNKTGLKILIDCGLFQGSKDLEDLNYEPFPFDPAQIDYLLVTHAHLDHIGRIPKLIKDGFVGKIYSTAPTKEVSEYSLYDSLNIQNKNNEKILFNEQDIKKALSLWEMIEYEQAFNLGEYQIIAKDAGHILGSTMWEFSRAGRSITFTGDLGNSPSNLLKDTRPLGPVNYVVMESVYGDRNHEDKNIRKNILEDVIEETMKKGGTLMIPAFSIERTQQILYEIESLMENSRIPLVPVFLDSPFGITVTKIYKKYARYLNDEVRNSIEKGNEIFHFPQLQMTLSTEQSKAIFRANPRKIIIASSGMSMGGRILHHEKRYLSDPNSTLLLVGYQPVGSLGRLIQDGVKSIKIMGEEISVNARIATIYGYSSHKDSDHLLDFVNESANSLEKVYLAMGEPKSALFLAQRIRDYLGIDARVPKVGERVELDI